VSGMSDRVSFAEIKKRVALEQVLRRYQIDWLRRSGPHQYRGRCPIHQGEGTGAFHANLERGVFHCFACGAGGNVLDFVCAMEGCSIREAALRLQEGHGKGTVVCRGSSRARLSIVAESRCKPSRRLLKERFVRQKNGEGARKYSWPILQNLTSTTKYSPARCYSSWSTVQQIADQ